MDWYEKNNNNACYVGKSVKYSYDIWNVKFKPERTGIELLKYTVLNVVLRFAM